MAKKKPTHHHHQDKPPQTQEEHARQSPPTAMEAASSEKLENLKSLNIKLIKEAVVRRQLVDSLIKSKESLESDLTLSEMEKEALQAELTRMQDTAVQLELESQVVSVVAGEQVNQQAEAIENTKSGYRSEIAELQKRLKVNETEMFVVKEEKRQIEEAKIEKEFEIGLLEGKLSALVAEIENERAVSLRLGRDRGALRAELDLQIEEANGLKAKLVEAEKTEITLGQEVQNLKMDYKGAMEEIAKRGRTIDSTVRDKEAVERSLAESNLVVEGLKRRIEVIAREKKEIEEERNAQVVKTKELEFTVGTQNDRILSLQSEDQRLRANFADLEKRCAEGAKNEMDMAKEINELMEEKKNGEKSIERLVEEKGLVQKIMDVALKELDEQKEKMDGIVRRTMELEEVKARRESEIVEMEREVSELRNRSSALGALCKDLKMKNGHLQSEVQKYEDEIKQVTVERNEARTGFDEKKRTGTILREKIFEMEKKIEETQKMAAEKEVENRNVLGEKKELERQCQILMKERASLENRISEAQKEVDDLQAKLELADANSELVMNMSRLIEDRKLGDSVKPFGEALEVIKAAFKNREAEVEDMKRQLEFMQNSVAEAHRKKSFWTLVSSAITVIAAASVAYVARGR